jgi:hypothetical protein
LHFGIYRVTSPNICREICGQGDDEKSGDVVGVWVAAISIAAARLLCVDPGMGHDRNRERKPAGAFQLMKVSARAPGVAAATARGTAPWLVQFAGALRAEDRAALENAGATIRG